VKDKASKAPAPALRNEIVSACFQMGLLALPCGSTTLRLIPPLVIGKKEADTALDILERALAKVEKGRR